MRREMVSSSLRAGTKIYERTDVVDYGLPSLGREAVER